jgi:hypothetical protein
LTCPDNGYVIFKLTLIKEWENGLAQIVFLLEKM